jgi:hypothetical protein
MQERLSVLQDKWSAKPTRYTRKIVRCTNQITGRLSGRDVEKQTVLQITRYTGGRVTFRDSQVYLQATAT